MTEKTDAQVAADGGMADAWCVLRTSGGRTMPLARSLTAAGFEVWTPVEKRARRKPRSKVTKVMTAPILPTFVFARARHLPDLIAELTMPGSDHPPFSIFRYSGWYALLRDHQIEPLRRAENDARFKWLKAQTCIQPFREGEQVTLGNAPFTGVLARVTRSDERFTEMSINSLIRLRFETSIVRDGMLGSYQPK